MTGRVVVITGAGRGLGRAYALAFAALGASVVVNDLGTNVAGEGRQSTVAQSVVDEIVAAGGIAIADTNDVTTADGGTALVARAVETYGRLDVLVCNAGAYRVEWLWDTSVESWESLMRVHLTGMFCPASAAIQHWRERSATEALDARLICITSQSGLFSAPASAAYDTAKTGVAGFVAVAAKELADIGVTVNGVAPRAQTRMTDLAITGRRELDAPRAGDGMAVAQRPRATRDPAPDDVAPFVTWLGSPASRDVSGRIFTVTAGRITLIKPWSNGPSHFGDLALEDMSDVVARLITASD